ncbi:MAG: hypothetical protein Kow00108_17460 [Calditrichia bacterium]
MTDFGTEDGYVGAMKGRIFSIAPQATIVDITHQIPRYNIRFASFTLLNIFPYFPEGSIHVVVIDPGVGSRRRALLMEVGGKIIICPDNGVASLIFDRYKELKIYSIGTDWISWDISTTFHGRDIFAPAAAVLAAGKEPDEIASPLNEPPVNFMLPISLLGQKRLQLRVLHIDHFGNIITNLHKSQFEELGIHEGVKLKVTHGFIYGIKKTYSDVGRGQYLLLWDSSGYLEIAQNQGNAALSMNIKENDELILEY